MYQCKFRNNEVGLGAVVRDLVTKTLMAIEKVHPSIGSMDLAEALGSPWDHIQGFGSQHSSFRD